MPGPSKTAREFKVIAGTDRKDRRDPDDVPQFSPVKEFPPAPQHLNQDGSALWKALGDQLVACGVLQVVDVYALEHLCYLWQLYRQKAKAGLDVTASESNALKALFSEFGLTPAARKRVVQNITEAPKGNRFAKFGKRST